LISESRVSGYVLDDPSRMSEKAVRAFLTHWLKRQTKGKVHPLLFRKPQNDEELLEDEQVNARDRPVEVAKTKAMEQQDFPSGSDDNRGNEEMDEEQVGGKDDDQESEEMNEEEVEPKDDSGRESGAGVQDGEDGGGGKESDEVQEQEAGDLDAAAGNELIPDTPSGVGKSKSQRLKYLQFLCNDPTYRSLLSLLKTAKVCIPVVMT
jgi:hypothetical protein